MTVNRLGAGLFPGVTQWLLPTPSALLFNVVRFPETTPPAALPNADWSRRERRLLLEGSEDRLRVIEMKGPGLAAAVAVVAAGVLVAVSSGWATSCWFGRVLLVGAAFYATSSLCMSLYLVGPQRRHTIGERELVKAGGAASPEEQLARDAAWAAARNNRRNNKLANLQDAARREAFYALALLLAWLVAAPLTGVAQ